MVKLGVKSMADPAGRKNQAVSTAARNSHQLLFFLAQEASARLLRSTLHVSSARGIASACQWAQCSNQIQELDWDLRLLLVIGQSRYSIQSRRPQAWNRCGGIHLNQAPTVSATKHRLHTRQYSLGKAPQAKLCSPVARGPYAQNKVLGSGPRAP